MVRAENDRARLCVILAGYPAETETLLASNPGLASRFPTRIHFPAYTADELVQIGEAMVTGMQRRLDPEGQQALATLIARQDLASTAWGNARSVRNLMGDAARRQTLRLTSTPGGLDAGVAALTTLTAADILGEQGDDGISQGAGAGDFLAQF